MLVHMARRLAAWVRVCGIVALSVRADVGREPCDDRLNVSTSIMILREEDRLHACHSARCASLPPSKLAKREAVEPLWDRWTIFQDELLVVTPHKAASNYVKSMFARAYGCAPVPVNRNRETLACGNHTAKPWDLPRAVVVRDPLDRVIAMYNLSLIHISEPTRPY